MCYTCTPGLKWNAIRCQCLAQYVRQSHLSEEGCAGIHTVSALPVPSAKLSPEMEAALGEEVWPEPMSVAVHQEKLLEKLNLDGLSTWTPWNTAVMKKLILAFHDLFMLDGNELSCTSATEHEIHISDGEPFKE